MSPRSHRQSGLAAAAVIIVIILAVIAMVLGRATFDSEELGLDQRGVTDARMKRIVDALSVYASLNRRLPCPARGDDGNLAADAVGRASPEAGTTAGTPCATPDGVVPWKSLGLPRETALDGWNRQISYRVFSPTGDTGFTHDESVRMTNCNSALGAPISPTLAPGLLCGNGAPPPHTPAQFLSARGNMLVVEDAGATRAGNAFVLLSHGESGYGAFPDVGATARRPSPNAAGREFTNTQATGTTWILPRSPAGTDPGAIAHFDDVVVYVTAADLVARAKLGARSWSDPLAATFDLASLTSAGATFPSAEDTGRHSLGLGGFLVSASSGGVDQNIGYSVDYGTGGIGVIGGGSTQGDLNSAFGEKLSFQLGEGSQYAKVDIAFNVFEIRDYSPLSEERAEMSFWRAGLPLQAITIDAWDPFPEPSRCLFRLPTGLVFDRFDVAALPQTGGGGSSRFTVAAVRACDNATTPCETNLAPTTAACPLLPASAAGLDASGVGTGGVTLNARVEDNGIASGTGSGYVTNGDSYPFGERLITVTSGTGTILDGNCVQVAGDATIYPVTRGIDAPGDLVIANPGLRQSIPGSPVNVTTVPCPTTVQFDWGLACSAGYSTSTNATPATINAGAGSTDVSAALTGLACGTSYHYRVRATNLIAATVSPNRHFRTSACGFSTPTVLTGTASVLTSTVGLAGTVNGNGESTTVSFEYGETSCYGNTIAATPSTGAAGAGATSVTATLPVVPPPIVAGQLRCGAVYHYRVVASAGSGTRHGENVTFRTLDCP